MTVGHPYDDLTLDDLRERRSAKWRRYPPEVLPAWVAEMDFPAAAPVVEALSAMVARGDFGYAHVGDLPATFAAWAGERQGWAVGPDRVTVLPDVLTGVEQALLFGTEPGAGVVIETPLYPPLQAAIQVTGRQAVPCPLLRRPDGRWAPDLERMAEAFRAGAQALILCHPHNPTGRVLSAAECAAVAELAAAHRVLVIADEVHAPLTYPGRTFPPFAVAAAAAGTPCVTATSASKGWNLPGLKCAVLVAGDDELQARAADIPARSRFGTSVLGIAAAQAAFADGEAWRADTVAYLDRNRRLLADLLAERLPGVEYALPDAGYLAWLDCRTLGLGPDPAATFLTEGQVALTSSVPFAPGGEGWVRLNFATTGAVLTEIVERMAAVVPAG